MKRILFAAIVMALAAGPALAQDPTCASKAVGKNGKALAGASVNALSIFALKPCLLYTSPSPRD